MNVYDAVRMFQLAQNSSSVINGQQGRFFGSQSAVFPSTSASFYQARQTHVFSNILPSFENEYRRQVTVTPSQYEYAESQRCTLSAPTTPVKHRTTEEVRSHGQRSIQMHRSPIKQKILRSCDVSSRVKLEIFLEKFDEGVFLTKARVDDGKWQDLKRKFQSLDYHQEILCRRTVESAINTMKKYKTLHVSLSEREAIPYMQKKFYIFKRKKAKPKSKEPIRDVNVTYQTNVYNVGPSVLPSNEVYSSYSDDSSDYSTD